MSTDQVPELLDLEKEYTKMNKDGYKDYCRYVIIVLSVIIMIEAITAFYQNRILTGVGDIGIVVVMLLGFSWIRKCENNYEIIITSVFIFCYFSATYLYARDRLYLHNVNMAYFFSYSCALGERIMTKMMADLNHRVYFTIIAVITRVICMPRIELTEYMKHFTPVVFTLLLDISRERRYKKFFYSYLNSREQLSKFKDLVVQHIPEAIAIVSQDLTKSLFVNNSFLELICGNKSHIQNQLSKFVVKEEAIEKTSNRDQTSINNKTLLEFIKSSFNDGPDQKKHKCITTLMKESCPNEVLDEDTSGKQLFEVKLFSMIWDDQPSIAIIFHDITEQHTVLSLKIADAQKDKVLATVSHELRTPLNGMLGMIQVMEKKIKDSELLRFLAICKSSTNLLVSLVSSILDLNQIRANAIKLNYENIDIQSLLRGIMGLFEYQCQQKGIYLKTQVEPGTPDFLFSDKDRLSQILINLVGNAQKFTSEGGVIVRASRDHYEGSVKFSVSDTGIGISKEDKKKLFQVYGKLSHNDERINRQGVGLGLTIAESLVEALNHNHGQQDSTREITVDSEQGKGCTFSFTIKPAQMQRDDSFKDEPRLATLPSIPNEIGLIQEKMELYCLPSGIRLRATSLRSPCSTQTPQSRDFYKADTLVIQKGQTYKNLDIVQPKPCILLVDDDIFNIAVAEHLILSHGYKVKTALSGQEAIDKVVNNNHDTTPIILILMDCQMPIMDGYEATRRLRMMMQQKSVPETPIVALTANDSEADKEACRKSGMCDQLSKPLKDDKLKRILKKYC